MWVDFGDCTKITCTWRLDTNSSRNSQPRRCTFLLFFFDSVPFLFLQQPTHRSSPTPWSSSTSSISSSSLWRPRGRPPFSRRRIPSPCCPNRLPTSQPRPASRPPSSIPPLALTLYTLHSTTPRLSPSSSPPSTSRFSRRWANGCVILSTLTSIARCT